MRTNSTEALLYSELFELLSRPLRNFIYYKCGDVHQAEDITQEAFLRLWKMYSKVQPEKAKSFLFTVANNLLLDQLKHQKVVLAFQRQVQPAASPPSPEFLYEQQEFHQRLLEAIAALPEKNRTVFLLSRMEKQTYQEIGNQLGITKKAVEKRMQKALTELRKLTDKL